MIKMKHARVINMPKNPYDLFKEAIELGSEYHIDEKGTKDHPSIAQRQPSKLLFDEAFEIIKNAKPHWVCIFRNISYLSDKEDDYWDLGGCTIAENDYGDVFIFIIVKPDVAEKLFEKYKLEVEWY
jgi:hypothetical protein